MQSEWFQIQQWTKDEQSQCVRRDVVYSDDDRFTIRDDVPMIEEDNNPYNGE
jgi:hypothetical protein